MSMKRLRITVEGRCYDVEVDLLEDTSTAAQTQVSAGSVRMSTPHVAANPPGARPPASAGDTGQLRSPLAALVVSIDVAIGDVVEDGQTVITLEAMKMNTTVAAPRRGTVTAIHVQVRDAVEENQLLLTLE